MTLQFTDKFVRYNTYIVEYREREVTLIALLSYVQNIYLL